MSSSLAIALGLIFGFFGGCIFCRLMLWEATRVLREANEELAKANATYDRAITFYKGGAESYNEVVQRLKEQ